MVRSPETKKPAPAPPGPAGAVFRFQGCATLFRDDFRFLFFPYIFRHICQGIHLNLPDSVPKKILAPIFWDISHFLFSKVESARADMPGPETQNVPSHFSDPIPKSDPKFYFLSFYTIFRVTY